MSCPYCILQTLYDSGHQNVISLHDCDSQRVAVESALDTSAPDSEGHIVACGLLVLQQDRYRGLNIPCCRH